MKQMRLEKRAEVVMLLFCNATYHGHSFWLAYRYSDEIEGWQ